MPEHALLKFDYLIGSVLVGAGGIIAGLVSGVLSAWLQRRTEQRKDRALRSIRLFRPLRDSSREFSDRLRELSRRRGEQMQRDMFAHIKDPHLGMADFVRWCNGEGNHWAESVFMAAKYYRCATWTREELRTVVTTSREETLLTAVERAREANGGQFRIYQSAQDSVGHKMGAPGQTTVDEQQFWEALGGREPWLQNLADFFRNLHMKNDDELAQMSASLDQVSRSAAEAAAR